MKSDRCSSPSRIPCVVGPILSAINARKSEVGWSWNASFASLHRVFWHFDAVNHCLGRIVIRAGSGSSQSDAFPTFRTSDGDTDYTRAFFKPSGTRA